jgi:hypothetical protein
MRKLIELSEVEREVVVTAEELTDAFGRLGTMEGDGVGQVLSLLQHAFAPTVESSEPRERTAFHYLIMMVQAFRDRDSQQQQKRMR